MSETEAIALIRQTIELHSYVPSVARALRECDGGNIRRVIGAVNLVQHDPAIQRCASFRARLNELARVVNASGWQATEAPAIVGVAA